MTNRKAARRTGDDGDSFGATAEARGDNFTPQPLRAASPARSDGTSLVSPDRPIPLGSFQVIRPIAVPDSAVDLDVLRIRFTPAAGEVYGPSTAVRGDDARTGRSYEMVPKANRVLNPASRWLQHRREDTDPQPSDTYDGAELESTQSWGVVDDTCDGTVAVTIVVGKRMLSATARVCVGPPDYAPDRRPFLSLADDLADRDLHMVEVDAATQASAQRRLTDLFSASLGDGRAHQCGRHPRACCPKGRFRDESTHRRVQHAIPGGPPVRQPECRRVQGRGCSMPTIWCSPGSSSWRTHV